MKPMILCLVLASLSSAPSCAAQTSAAPASTMPHKLTPEQAAQLALEMQTIFRAARRIHHRDQTPQEQQEVAAAHARQNELLQAGQKALDRKDFAAAEGYFREEIKINDWPPIYFGLGEALAGQGRVAEAVAAYRDGIYQRTDDGTPYGRIDEDDRPYDPTRPKLTIFPGAGVKVWMGYVLLLDQMGHDAEAVTVYRNAVPSIADMNEDRIQALRDFASSSPAALRAAAHIGLGLSDTFGTDGSVGGYLGAMCEFDTARRLQPDAALTNYYYGYGWQRLTPAQQAKFSTAEQAQAALLKAVRVGKGEVKKAAQKALLVAMRPK